jgi:hypothetical protein
MDVTSGALRDLTPDGAAKRFALAGLARPKGPPVLVDAVPAWSPDGKALVFARSVDGQSSTCLYRIAASGSRPKLVAVIATDLANALSYGLRWLPDGRILYSLDYPANNDDPRNGLWRVSADGTPREILKADPKLGALLLLRTTPDASTAPVWYYKHDSTFNSPSNASPFALVKLASGARRSAPMGATSLRTTPPSRRTADTCSTPMPPSSTFLAGWRCGRRAAVRRRCCATS